MSSGNCISEPVCNAMFGSICSESPSCGCLSGNIVIALGYCCIYSFIMYVYIYIYMKKCFKNWFWVNGHHLHQSKILIFSIHGVDEK